MTAAKHTSVPGHRRWVVVVLSIVVMGVTDVGLAQFEPERVVLPATLKRYDTPYYSVHTDMGEEVAKEAAIRLSCMAEVYSQRTREFSGRIRDRFPFLLFSTEADYHGAGGTPGSDGVFIIDPRNGSRLMAIGHDPVDDRTWHVMQHEGFHQFAQAVIGGDLPIWVNEGLAEYFGEGIFTGDGYVTGVVPAWRLKRVREQIEARRFLPVADMMMMSHAQWNLMLDSSNYDQAWAMVHFLAHAEGGRYQKAFTQFMVAINRGVDWQRAWLMSFGSAQGFEDRFVEYWKSLPDKPTESLYVQATALTLSSYLARAVQQGETFADWDAFLTAADKGELKCSAGNWLPPVVLENAIKRVKAGGEWSLDAVNAKSPRIIVKIADGSLIVAEFRLKGQGVASVTAEVDTLPVAIAQARQLLSEEKNAEARRVLSAAMKDSPRSTAMEEARTLAVELRTSKPSATPRE